MKRLTHGDIKPANLLVEATGSGCPCLRVAEVADGHYEWDEQTTKQLRRRPGKRDEEATVHDVQALFRSVASAEEWLEVVASVRERHPRVAELVYVYGIARSDEALAHWAKTMG